MNHHDVEIEIQVQVEHVDALKDYLEERGQLVGTSEQRDEYFTPAHRDFLKERPVYEWLRIRTAGEKHSVNYKTFHYTDTGKTTYCDEHELTISSADAMRTILLGLNFTSRIVVMKRREIWNYKQYEIALDQVEGLPATVEVEYKGASGGSDAMAIKQEMIKFLKDLRCGKLKLNDQGYPFLLMFPNEAKFEEL